jgi:hypothetical protein
LEAIATLFFLTLGQDLEEKFGAVPVEFHVAELVDAEKIDTAVAGDRLVRLLLVRGFDQLVDQLRCERVADAVALHRGLGAQSDEHAAVT